MADTVEFIYVLDTNALIDLHRRLYPRSTFPGLWEDIEGLCDAGLALIPEEVRAELENIDDDLLAWVRSRPDIVAHLDSPQIQWVRRVLAEFPGLVRTKRTNPQADAFVVALGLARLDEENARLPDLRRAVAVVTQEKRDLDLNLKRKIPNACAYFGLPCMNLLDFFASEGWRYVR